ncbi:protein translocase subunit SecF [Candidatus Jorgensenbacteria bacterium]|nr:protein translocase subunit SecF [Candidatus Jorgensenbacteria bacterium]
MNLIANKNIFLIFSGMMVVLACLAIVVFGLRSGIDLKGGTQWDVSITSTSTIAITENIIHSTLKKVVPTAEVVVKQLNDGSFSLRLPEVNEKDHQLYSVALSKIGRVEEKSFSSIGPIIGSELRRKAMWAIVFVMLGISIYVAWAFRKVSDPIRSWKYGAVTLLTLLHDVIIPTGLLAILGRFKGIEIDTNFIVALLVVMGFSVHDTIVVFDRIRENLLIRRGQKIDLGLVVNQSVRETFTRSINTSLTLILVLIALIVVGPSSLFYFVLTLLVGTIFGTYSSIFVASPLLYLWGRRGT